MNTPLVELRELFNRERILLCFNGPFSRTLIEEIGTALRRYMEAEQTQPTAATDVFAAYIELTQNIRHYAVRQGYGETESVATVIIARDEEGRHIVSAGNLVEPADGQALLERIAALAPLDRAQIKAAWKDQLRRRRDPNSQSGAGIGLLDIARRCREPLSASLSKHPDGRAFLSLRAVI